MVQLKPGPLGGRDWTEMPRMLTRGVIVICIILVAVIGFLLYSLIVTFDNWPWTRSEVFTSGSYRGFTISSDKRIAFDRSIVLQQDGTIRTLTLLDAIPTTYGKKYRGAPIRQVDFPHVSESDRWHLGLSECNCWLVLEFANGQLSKLTRYEYYGPTE